MTEYDDDPYGVQSGEDAQQAETEHTRLRWSRLLRFRAGPWTQQNTFHACIRHRHYLEAGNVLNFMEIGGEETRFLRDEDVDCDFCRAED